MLKCATIFFHSNAKQLYKQKWIDKCIASIKAQTVQADLFELDYSGKGEQLVEGSSFISLPLTNHIEALNILLAIVFANYDVCFLTNIDDSYSPFRFEKQLQAISNGFKLVSSNFCYINERDEITVDMNMAKYDIASELKRGHNVIAHPCVAMHKDIWESGLRYNENEIGYEDLSLWQKIDPAQICILPDYLLYYRIHANQITKR